MRLLTSFHVRVEHHIDHVFDVLEALTLKMLEYLPDEFLLSPDEQHALLHDVGWDYQLFELVNVQA